mmetsp:Transcript_7396/g.19958  ORF Transcript_7396/g.19958 Transcript_7396/m.19958 type:complete len:135 (+) Transcript_7396:72-476(+)
MASGQGSTRVGLTPQRSNPSLRNHGGLTPASSTCGSDQATYLMPACFKSHKALAGAFRKSPELFSGGGERLLAHQEKYPAQSMSSGARHVAYLRRQLHQTEPEVEKQSMQADPWPAGEPKPSGAPFEVIHRDLK